MAAPISSWSWCSGEDLRHVLQREGRLETPRALRILTAVCGAIEAAHRQGVLHRDLKPENILLPTREVEAKVLDFGVAKVIDDRGEQETAVGRIAGHSGRHDRRHAGLHGARTASRPGAPTPGRTCSASG